MDMHPQLAAMIAKAAGAPPLASVPVATIRAGDVARYDFGLPKEPVAGTEDRVIDGSHGPIPIRIYRPEGAGPHPITMFFHGSGFVICSIDSHDAMCRQICNRGGSILVSVEYRLAPEHRFPAAPDDCYAATVWAAANGTAFGGDPARLAVCGDSAGGTMAAVVTLRARDEDGPAIAAQILIYPVTDHYSVMRPSWDRRGTGCGLTADSMRWFWDQYLPDPGLGAHPHASPIRAASLANLPPALVITGGYDLLSDEGDAYAHALTAVGVDAELIRYADMNHGFLFWVGLIDRSTEAMDAIGAYMRRQLGASA
jgi:acetyl esterase